MAREDGLPIPEPRYRAPTRAAPLAEVVNADFEIAVGAMHEKRCWSSSPRR